MVVTGDGEESATERSLCLIVCFQNRLRGNQNKKPDIVKHALL
jgi:hypothetical protein